MRNKGTIDLRARRRDLVRLLKRRVKAEEARTS